MSYPHQNRILGLSRGWKWLLSAILPIESSLYWLKEVALSVGQEVENDFKVTFDNLNHRFFDFIQIEFSASPLVQIKLRMPSEPLEHRFLELIQVAFSDGQEAGNEFKVTCDTLKHFFFVFTQVAFWTGQEEINDFPVIGDHLNHRFFDFIKMDFQLVQTPKISWECLSRPWYIAFRPHPSRILGWLSGENKFKVTCEPLQHCFLDLNQVAFWDC